MDCVDYMGLSDDLFFTEVFSLYDEENREKLQFLKDRPFIMERFKNLVLNYYIKGNKRQSSINFIKLYESYVVLSNVFDVISNPLGYYDEERIQIFKSYSSFTGDFRGLRLFSRDEKKLINHVINGYRVSEKVFEKNKNIEQYDIKYENIVSLLKRILRAYSKYGDSNKLYSLLYDDMKIKQASLSVIIKYTKVFFYQSLCSGTNIINKNILNDFSLNDIYLLEKIDSDYSKIFEAYKFDIENVCVSISDYEKLFKLFDQIGTSLSRRKGLEYAAGYVSNELRIPLGELESYYYSVFMSFCNFKLQGFECDSSLKNYLDNRTFKFSDISNFTSVMTMYRELTHRSIYLCQVLCSDRKNIDNLISIIYEMKFFNNVTPSINNCCLSSRLRFLNFEEREKCQNFISGYRQYYNLKKDTLNEEKMQEITDNEISNMDSYAANVKLFLESGCKSIDDYFGENLDDKKLFELSLKVLEKYDHPIYQRYSDYLSFINNEYYNRMIGDCIEISKLINNGVVSIDGSKRDFDLVDYYLYTDLSKQKFMDMIRDRVSNDEYSNVSRFFFKHKGDKRIEGADIDKLYTTKISFPCEWDKDGNVISYYDATKEDIMDAIVTIEKMGIPLTSMTYGIILRNKVLKNIDEKNLTNCKKRV